MQTSESVFPFLRFRFVWPGLGAGFTRCQTPDDTIILFPRLDPRRLQITQSIYRKIDGGEGKRCPGGS